MKKPTAIILDLDGTLYPFKGTTGGFSESRFYAELKQSITAFIAAKLCVCDEAAVQIVADVDKRFSGELSIGFERTFGIDRYEYYAATWDKNPANFMDSDKILRAKLVPFQGRALVLTAAPRMWADRALRHLGIDDVFDDRIITGEPDIRKPDPAVFWQAAKHLGHSPDRIISIGDQNHSDIRPARSIGMTTVIIGPDQMDAHYRADTIYQALDIVEELQT